MTEIREQTMVLAYVATALSEEDLLLIIVRCIQDLTKARIEKDKLEETEQRKFLKFVMSVYVTKYSYIDPYEIVAQAEQVERIMKLVTPSNG